jgi:molybdopterin-guanine dinucleotide biosynthesis protein A
MTAAVLAGGEGSRLGGAKAAAPLAGRPLISYPIAAARSAGLEVFVVAKASSELPPLDVEVVVEPEQPRHPVLGVLSALERSGENGAVLALACDMPFLPAELLRWLASLQGPVLLRSGGRLHPLPGVYPTAAKTDLLHAVRCVRRSPSSARASSGRASCIASATPSGCASTSTTAPTSSAPARCSASGPRHRRPSLSRFPRAPAGARCQRPRR